MYLPWLSGTTVVDIPLLSIYVNDLPSGTLTNQLPAMSVVAPVML